MSIYRREVSRARVILGMGLFGGMEYGGGVVGKKLPAKIGDASKDLLGWAGLGLASMGSTRLGWAALD